MNRTPMPAAIRSRPRLERRERLVRLGILLAALGLVAVAVGSRYLAPVSAGRPPVANAAWVIPDVLLRGGQPRDIDLVNMKSRYRLAGVVNLRQASALDAAVAADYGLMHIGLELEQTQAPDREELRAIVAFVRARIDEGGAVLIHDEVGLDRAPTVGVMLAMLHGTSATAAIEAARDTGAFGDGVSDEQRHAINSLSQALGGPASPAGVARVPAAVRERYSYPDAGELRW